MNYPTRIEIRSERTGYYVRGTRYNPPASYLEEEDIYVWVKRNGKFTLYDLARQEFVVRRQKKKFLSIGTNKLHSTNINNSSEAVSQIKNNFVFKVKDALKKFFKEEFTKIEVEDYPVGVRFTFMGPDLNDLDNHDIYYRKVALDVLQKLEYTKGGKKIPNKMGCFDNDDVKHIAMLHSVGILSEHKALIIEVFKINITELKNRYEGYVKDHLSNIERVSGTS